jgi:hypothetical protein
MAITASRVINEKVSPVSQSFLMTAGEEIFAGYPLVIKPADGKAYMITTDGYVAGVSVDHVASGGEVRVHTGIWELPADGGVTSVDVGQTAYITDEGSVSTISSAGQDAGTIVACERTGYVFVQFGYPIA